MRSMNMSISSREIALKILHNIDNGAYSNAELKTALRGNISREDKGLATEIVYGVTSNRTRLDHVISYYSKLPVKRISGWILNIIRIGIYQLLFLDRIPESAAVNECVKLAKRYGHSGSAGFVNGMLRNVAKNGEPPLPEDASVVYSHPNWLIDMWKAEYGFQFTQDILAANNQRPAITLRANRLKTTAEELARKFESLGANIQSIQGNSIQIQSIGNVENMEEYKQGLFMVQDRASMLAVESLAPKPGDFVMDVCAAPGGKATYIAELMNNSGKIIALDLHQHKVDIIDKNAKRLGVDIINACVHNAEEIIPEFIGKADRVLADVPCSGLGIIRKKPDIKWTKSLKDIDDLTVVQGCILNTAARYLKPGGRLVYSTCTISPKENRMQIESFLSKNPNFELRENKQLFPHIDRCDGFFIGVIECME